MSCPLISWGTQVVDSDITYVGTVAPTGNNDPISTLKDFCESQYAASPSPPPTFNPCNSWSWTKSGDKYCPFEDYSAEIVYGYLYDFWSEPNGNLHYKRYTGAYCLARVVCPVAPLTPLEDLIAQYHANDPQEAESTWQLEAGANGYRFLTPETQQAEQCLAQRFADMGLSYTITSTYRTKAYQAHLRELWQKWNRINEYKKDDPAIFEACREVKATLDAEMGKSEGDRCTLPGRAHCLVYAPSEDSRHQNRKAFDIRRYNVEEFEAALKVQMPKQTVQQYLDVQPSCDLTWGGTFRRPDIVHFQLKN